jgi:DNA modification methylase
MTKFRELNLSEIKNANYNPRKISKDSLKGLENSIKRFGLVEPIIWNEKSGNIVGGHQRVKVLQSQGIEKTQGVVVDLSDDEEKALNITLNNKSIEGDWDQSKIDELIREVKAAIGNEAFTDLKLDDLAKELEIELIQLQGATDPDQVPEIHKNPVTKLGDLWKLGNHRLLCGDSTEALKVQELLNGEKIDLVFTDPPYGVSLEDTGKLWCDVFSLWRVYFADYSSYYIATASGGGLLDLMMRSLFEAGMSYKHILIWNKNNHVLGRCDYHYKHEPILYGWVNAHKFYGEGQHNNSVWDIPKPLKNELHPTMKPIALIENCILNSSKLGNLVADMFLGSGSTIIACEKTERRCYGMELSPSYCDVIVKRWEDFTGKKAELL